MGHAEYMVPMKGTGMRTPQKRADLRCYPCPRPKKSQDPRPALASLEDARAERRIAIYLKGPRGTHSLSLSLLLSLPLNFIYI